MLHVSPPSVSRMLRHSEMLAGMSFFSRTSSGFVPTPEVVALMEDLEEIHDGILRINRRLDAALNPTEGRLTIGVSPGLGVSLVPQALAAMRRERPDVNIAFDVLHRDEIATKLILQQVDLAMAIFDVEDPRIESQQLAEGRLVCLVPEGHRLAGRTSIGLSELADETFVGFNASQFQQVMIDDLLTRSGVTLRPKLRVRLTVSAYFMVQNGLGIALLDSFTVASAKSHGVCVVPLKEILPFQLRLFFNREAPLSQIAMSFLSHVTGGLK